ncbi:MAG: glycerol-3-phosphate acyltransferase, partial [Bdellovibrio sp.]|nr:glycerol-3-phosphate acyltransferase [Bdellovibrio sp.]
MNETLLESIKLTRFLVPFLLIFAFLLGSIPFGLIVSRMFNLKPMGRNPQRGEEAKKARDLWPGGVLTFCLDFGKGLLAVFLATPEGAQLVLNLLGVVDVGSEMVPLTATWGAGFAVVFGHCFSPFLNFRGGKGV